MKTETIYLLPNPRLMARVDGPGCVITVHPDLEHLDDALWAQLQPHLKNGRLKFKTEADAAAAGALVKKTIPYR